MTTPENKILSQEETAELRQAFESSTQGEWWDDRGLLWIPRNGLHSAGMGIPHGTDSTFCAKVHNLWPRVEATIRELQRQLDGRDARLANLRAAVNHVMSTNHPEPAPETVILTIDAPVKCLLCGRTDMPSMKIHRDAEGNPDGFTCYPNCEASGKEGGD